MRSERPEHLRGLIANERKERVEVTTGIVVGFGHEAIARELEVTEVAAATAQTRPDVALVGLGESSEHALELISRIVQEATCPVIALLESRDPEFVNEAARRGIFAYITHGDSEELQSSIDIALRRFAEYHNLEGAFGRRALTERAKGILMERHAIDEQSAFEMLRAHSRRTGRKVIDVAGSIVDSHLMLPAQLSGEDSRQPGAGVEGAGRAERRQRHPPIQGGGVIAPNPWANGSRSSEGNPCGIRRRATPLGQGDFEPCRRLRRIALILPSRARRRRARVSYPHELTVRERIARFPFRVKGEAVEFARLAGDRLIEGLILGRAEADPAPRHSPTMTLDTYGHVFEEFEGSERASAEEQIRRARDKLVSVLCPSAMPGQSATIKIPANRKADARIRTGDPFITRTVGGLRRFAARNGFRTLEPFER